MTSSSLIHHWSEQLRETEELLEHGSPHLRWLRLAYARLYRFLLSFYGAVPIDQRDAGDLESAEPNGLMVDPSVDFRGKPARTGMQILKTLQSVADSQDQIEAGPLQGGLQATDWIVVASAREVDLLGVRQTLDDLRIPYRIIGSGTDAALEILCRDRGEIREVIDHWRSLRAAPAVKPRKPSIHSTIFVTAVYLGAILFYALLSTFFWGVTRSAWIAHPLTCLVIGVIVGIAIAYHSALTSTDPLPKEEFPASAREPSTTRLPAFLCEPPPVRRE